ncbi:DNA polymerase II [candidate division KSB3 bacterium]|uniref:DNA polymerase n=1 Tax=candidate division KSB3 bacterium TaxID=2044937 RepID=A0A2G6KEE8_9BACT|nr:MAG: DNA polymerase II [candidate division KSB3 bacterium]
MSSIHANAMKQIEGFLLTSHWQDTRQGCHLVFYGISDSGPFKAIIDNSPPVFFIKRSCQHTFHNGIRRAPVELRNFAQEDVDALYFNTYNSLTETRDRLHRDGATTYESDVRPTDRFLMERFINGGIHLEGQDSQHKNLLVFTNSMLVKSEYSPSFNVFSLDIETSPQGELYSIAYHCYGKNLDARKVFVVGNGPKAHDLDIQYVENEKQLLQAFHQEFLRLDPDILIGWHVVGFDLTVLQERYRQYGFAFNLGRENSVLQIVARKGRNAFASMRGRVVLDGPTVMRAAFYSFENFKLETVAHELLGVGKDIQEDGKNKVAEISRRFHNDKIALARYNLQDCLLVSDIFNKTELIQLLVTRTKISGMLFEQIGRSSAAFDHFYLPLLHRRGFVAPNVTDIRLEGHSAGGYVLEPQAGLHEHVVLLDFRSLYPSIIQTFKLDPLSRICQNSNPLTTPASYRFSRVEHILPAHIERLLAWRAEAKQQNDVNLSQAIKILMNSFYGVMGSSGCRFYHKDLPSAITSTGQWVLQTAMAFLSSQDYTVLYGDTDSLFVTLKKDEACNFNAAGTYLARQVSEHLKKTIDEKFHLESYLEMEYEKYFPKLFLPQMRSGKGGAKKRYAGLYYDSKSQRNELYFVGMEIVRSDWTKLAKRFQYELFERLFNDQDIIPWITTFVDNFRAGVFHDLLVYKKRLRKGIDGYVKSMPPHVKAAKQLLDAGMEVPREIEYVMTLRGPVPAVFDHQDIDYAHYIDKQIRPLADSVLWIFNSSFDDISSGNQLALF